MKKLTSLFLAFMLILSLAACGVETTPNTSDGTNPSQSESKVHKQTDYPKMEEIAYSFRDTVRYGEPVAAFDYTNNSDYTILCLQLYFKMKAGVTSEQLQLTHVVGNEPVTDEEIPEMKPYVYDWIVCDPGETAENAACYMVYNTEPTNTAQCALMDLTSAEIHFIGDDNKEHVVSYSAENDGYYLSEKTYELFTWIDNDFTKQIPKPETRVANAEMYNDNLYVKAYDISYDTFLSYVNACEEKGFQNNYPGDDIDYSYYGTNADGYEISIRFIDYMQYIEISLEKLPEGAINTEEEPTPDGNDDEDENNEDGIRPEFKEAMDSYEAFYDEYCEFMEKYKENPSDLNLLAEYAEMMEKLEDMNKKFEAWGDDDLSDAELKYYLEVNDRIAQKLIDAM